MQTSTAVQRLPDRLVDNFLIIGISPKNLLCK